MRHVVIGDVGGHADPLRQVLRRLGIDPDTGSVPADLTVVQVGDLIHRGPESEAVVEVVDRLLRHGEGRWVQLVGNHGAQYLRHPAFQWRDWISSEAADTLRGWWATGDSKAAWVVPSADGDLLVTHAGLTEEFWRKDLDSPGTAVEAAERLNEMASHGDNALFRGGVMLTGRTNLRAGPLWAEVGREVLPSWDEVDMPFGQVHGHSSLYDWRAGRWRVGAEVAQRTMLDRDAGHEVTWAHGAWVVGVDPDHSDVPAAAWRAWETDEDMPVGRA